MPEFAYILSEQYIKDNSPIDANVDSIVLRTAMRTAQDVYIRDLVGSGIYDAILTQINSSGTTTGSLYETLVAQYIAPCLIHYIISECTVPMTFKFMGKTIATRSDDNVSPVDVTQLAKVAAYYKDRAEYYAQRLTDYLRANTATYPLYLNPGNDQTAIHPKSTAFFGGIFMSDKYDDCDCYDPEEPKN